MLKDRLVEEKKDLQLREKSQSKVTISIKEIILQSILSFIAILCIYIKSLTVCMIRW